jgi:ABC-type uncharacterized transport system involved in gliding motility auxiliary subunit
VSVRPGLATRLSRRIQELLPSLLVVAAAALVAALSLRYQWHWDWTAAQRNTLSGASAELLRTLESAPKLTAYVREDPLLRQQVRDLVQRYQRLRPDIELEFLDPDRHPQLARELGITAPIEIEAAYGDRLERIQGTSEEDLSNALQRLVSRPETWVASVTGHGERDPLGQANHDLGKFGQELQRKGFRVQPLNLAVTKKIPNNTRVLWLAGPATPLLATELELIRAYLARGGNLLWLTDPDPQEGLGPLLDDLGVHPLPGLVVDANVRGLGLDDPTFALVSAYPAHPITDGLDSVSLYPKAKALETVEDTGWQSVSLLPTLQGSWNETGPIRGRVGVNPEQGERLGPLTLGLALTRAKGDREQRVVVVGDGDFLSNAYLGNAGNLDLGLRILRWLSGDERLLRIPARSAPDRTLELSPLQAGAIGIGFLMVLPLLLLGIGALVLWRRSRA